MLKRTQIDNANIKCTKCNTWLKIQIYHNKIGYYLGFFCPYCNLYIKKSKCFKSRTKAEIKIEQLRYKYLDEKESIRYSAELEYKYKEVG